MRDKNPAKAVKMCTNVDIIGNVCDELCLHFCFLLQLLLLLFFPALTLDTVSLGH